MKKFLHSLILPLIFLTVTGSLFIVWKIFELPTNEETIALAEQYFNKYGLWVILVSAVIEGLLLFGWYYPGSMVMFLGVIFAGKDVGRVVGVMSVVTIGLYFAYWFNFLIGKYGWYRLFLKFGLKQSLDDAQKRLTKYGLLAIFLSYWHPASASLISTAAGILRFPKTKFLAYSLIAVLLWHTFGATVVYFAGHAALSVFGLKFILIFIGIWIIFKLINARRNFLKENLGG